MTLLLLLSRVTLADPCADDVAQRGAAAIDPDLQPPAPRARSLTSQRAFADVERALADFGPLTWRFAGQSVRPAMQLAVPERQREALWESVRASRRVVEDRTTERATTPLGGTLALADEPRLSLDRSSLVRLPLQSTTAARGSFAHELSGEEWARYLGATLGITWRACFSDGTVFGAEGVTPAAGLATWRRTIPGLGDFVVVGEEQSGLAVVGFRWLRHDGGSYLQIALPVPEPVAYLDRRFGISLAPMVLLTLAPTYRPGQFLLTDARPFLFDGEAAKKSLAGSAAYRLARIDRIGEEMDAIHQELRFYRRAFPEESPATRWRIIQIVSALGGSMATFGTTVLAALYGVSDTATLTSAASAAAMGALVAGARARARHLAAGEARLLARLDELHAERDRLRAEIEALRTVDRGVAFGNAVSDVPLRRDYWPTTPEYVAFLRDEATDLFAYELSYYLALFRRAEALELGADERRELVALARARPGDTDRNGSSYKPSVTRASSYLTAIELRRGPSFAPVPLRLLDRRR